MVENRKHFLFPISEMIHIKPWDCDFPCLLKFARLMVTFMLIAQTLMFDSPSSHCFIFFYLIALHLFVLYSPSTLFQIFMSEKQGHSSGGVCQIHREPPRCTEWPPLCTPTP